MITDKIKFKPGYAKADSKSYADAGVEVKGISAERIWRNLTNISVWPRMYKDIVDIQYEDSSDNDPHLFDKAQFNYDLDDGSKVVAQVIEFVAPKDDRVGRLAYQGTVMRDGKEVNSLVMEFMVGVASGSHELTVETAMSCKEEASDGADKNYGDMLEKGLAELVEWSKKHD